MSWVPMASASLCKVSTKEASTDWPEGQTLSWRTEIPRYCSGAFEVSLGWRNKQEGQYSYEDVLVFKMKPLNNGKNIKIYLYQCSDI